MRDDLLDAKAYVDWAEAQISVLQERFLAWQRTRPYDIVMEDEPETGGYLFCFYLRKPLDPLINVDVAAILNSLRSGLDSVAAALAKRNGVKPSRDTHFPLLPSQHNFLDPLHGIEAKKWLRRPDLEAIKSIKPYKGGNTALWTMYRLNNLGKHERLIILQLSTVGLSTTSPIPGAYPVFKVLEDKTVLLHAPPGTPKRTLHQGNSYATVNIGFDEWEAINGGGVNNEVVPTLRSFLAETRRIVALFDAP